MLLSFLINISPDSKGFPAGHNVLGAVSVLNKSCLRMFIVNIS